MKKTKYSITSQLGTPGTVNLQLYREGTKLWSITLRCHLSGAPISVPVPSRVSVQRSGQSGVIMAAIFSPQSRPSLIILTIANNKKRLLAPAQGAATWLIVLICLLNSAPNKSILNTKH